MMARRKRQPRFKNERHRLLHLIAKNGAQLEWPCTNQILAKLVDGGLVSITNTFAMHWNNGAHKCVALQVNEQGKAELATYSDEI